MLLTIARWVMIRAIWTFGPAAAVLLQGCSRCGDPEIHCTNKIYARYISESRLWYLEHKDAALQNGVVDGVILDLYTGESKVLVHVDSCDSRSGVGWYYVFDDSVEAVGPLDEVVFDLKSVKKTMSRIDLNRP